ncbi:hypothetical protein XENORESO_018897, partial [Xenotaenia resolanae]
FYTELLSAGLLRPLDCHIEGLQHKEGNKDYVTPLGTSSVVKHFLSESGADLYLEYHVTGLYYRGGSWEVERNGGSEKFDAVILTMPVPQILQLQGDLGNCKTLTNNQKQNQINMFGENEIDGILQVLNVDELKYLGSTIQREQLEGVRYSSRFAIALFFSPEVVFSFTWGARYVTDSHCIRYIAVDNKKRSIDAPGLGPSLVVHTSVPFGLENLEIEKNAIQPIILQELHRLLPDLPQPISIKSQKWRYSQVLTSVPNCPGHMTILEQPLLICGGDAFTHSNFDGCVESALSVLRAFKVSLDIQKNA